MGKKIFNLFNFKAKIEVMDVGAAAIAEEPIYKVLLDKKIAHLTAFDGDERQIKKLNDIYGEDNVTVLNHFLFDGDRHSVYFSEPKFGMTSVFKPNPDALNFFNGFATFGKVESVKKVQTTRLDEIKNLTPPDFLKMDVQGAELGILKNGRNTLNKCLAMQLEVSYFPLYENQPSFGEIDVHMRSLGFVPHCFMEIKRWSISPTIINNNFRNPGNQLLEADIVYVRDPLKLSKLSDLQLRKLAILSHYAFKSVDFCTFILLELEKRNTLNVGAHRQYLENLTSFD